jgi:hypothetical protein
VIDLNYSFEAELWTYPAPEPWIFLSMPEAASDEIKFFKKHRTGFGSVKLTITIGETTWKTSGFPSKELNTFIIPIKKAVRKAEGITSGDRVSVQVHVALEPF